MIERSGEIKELAIALAKAQAVMQHAAMDGSNPAYKKADGSATKYATLANIYDAARPYLSENGLSVIQPIDFNPDITPSYGIITILMHITGQFFSTRMPLSVAANATPQQVASAASYARRMAYASIIGVATEDDDGNEAEVGAKTEAAGVRASSTTRKATQPVSLKPIEGLPVAIAAPVSGSDGEQDWLKWCMTYSAHIAGTKTVTDLDKLISLNALTMGNMFKAAPVMHKRILDNIDKKRSELMEMTVVNE